MDRYTPNPVSFTGNSSRRDPKGGREQLLVPAAIQKVRVSYP